MKKRFVCFLTAIVTALCACACLIGCGGEPDDGRTKINFYFYEAGYGAGWAETLAARYNASQSEVRVVPYGDYEMFSLAQNEITRGTDLADIYTLTSVEELSRGGYLEDLGDLYGRTVENIDGKDYTLDDLVDDYAKNDSTINGVTYSVPWFGNNMSIVYNAAMFENNGWEIPETMTEFFDLCYKIKDAGIDPLVFCGSTDQGYIPTLLDTWLWQAEGDANMEEFLKFESAEVYKNQEASRTRIYDTIARMVKDEKVYKKGSNAYNNQQAQREFIMGNAAMIVNGAWISNEMSALLADYPSFRMAIMNIPHINDDKKGRDGTDTSNILVKNSTHFVIPKNAPHKEEAKDFLVWLSRQENLQTFADECNGTVRPYKLIHPNTDNLTEFGKSVFEVATTTRPVVYESDAAIYKRGYVGLFMAASGEYVTSLITQPDLSAARAQANVLAKQDYTIAKNTFETWAGRL